MRCVMILATQLVTKLLAADLGHRLLIVPVILGAVPLERGSLLCEFVLLMRWEVCSAGCRLFLNIESGLCTILMSKSLLVLLIATTRG